MKYIETVDQNGNNWKLKTVKNEKYPSKKLLFLELNGKEIKVMNFVTERECNMFWDLLKNHLKGGILEAKEEVVQHAENSN